MKEICQIFFVRQEARHFYIFVSVKRLRQLLPFLRKEALVRTISRDGNFIVMHFAGGIKDEAALLKNL